MNVGTRVREGARVCVILCAQMCVCVRERESGGFKINKYIVTFLGDGEKLLSHSHLALDVGISISVPKPKACIEFYQLFYTNVSILFK